MCHTPNNVLSRHGAANRWRVARPSTASLSRLRPWTASAVFGRGLAIDYEIRVARERQPPPCAEMLRIVLQIVGPRPGGVQREPRANVELFACQSVPRSTPHTASLATRTSRFDVIAGRRAGRDRGSFDERQHESRGVVHLAVFEHDGTGQVRSAQMREMSSSSLA